LTEAGDIWVTTKNDTGWDTPVRLPAPVNTPDNEEGRPAISADGRRLYFESNRTGGYGNMDIWVARWNGNTWDSITNLGPKINTSVNESRPSLSFDGQKLYFSDFGGAARPGGYGSSDLWESVWTDSGWNYPTNVGAPVNTDLIVCSCFPKGDSLLYLGSESFDGAFGDEDIWQTNKRTDNNANDFSFDNIRDIRIAKQDGWSNTGELAGAMYVYDLLEAYDGTIYAATVPNGDVFKTTDGGATWQNTSDLADAIMAFGLIQAQDSAIYCGTYPYGDVFKTTDAGNTWTNTADIPNVTSVRSLLQTRDGKILAGGYDGKAKIYATTNGGQTWDSLATIPFIGNGVFCLYQAFNGNLYAGAWGFPGVSTNGGRTWIPMTDFPFPGEHRSINSIIQTSDSILWCTGWIHGHGGYVFKSTDRGLTWDSTARIMRGPVHVVRVYDLLEMDDGSLLIGFQPAKDTVCFRTTDRGQTWQYIGTMPDAYNVLCFLKTRSGEIYAGTTPEGDVFKYTSVAINESNISIYGNELKISPNPARKKFTISSPLLKTTDARLKIYNALGNLIKEIKPMRKEEIIISIEEKGVIFIVLEFNGKAIKKKVISSE
jgi:photosystem II stability/assembly factor-like uncharacterized protein